MLADLDRLLIAVFGAVKTDSSDLTTGGSLVGMNGSV
jgi:hypothetical protein